MKRGQWLWKDGAGLVEVGWRVKAGLMGLEESGRWLGSCVGGGWGRAMARCGLWLAASSSGGAAVYAVTCLSVHRLWSPPLS